MYRFKLRRTVVNHACCSCLPVNDGGLRNLGVAHGFRCGFCSRNACQHGVLVAAFGDHRKIGRQIFVRNIFPRTRQIARRVPASRKQHKIMLTVNVEQNFVFGIADVVQACAAYRRILRSAVGLNQFGRTCNYYDVGVACLFGKVFGIGLQRFCKLEHCFRNLTVRRPAR